MLILAKKKKSIKFNQNVRCLTFFRLIEISSDPESVAARRAVRRKILEQKISLMATLEDDQNKDKRPRIMGALILLVNSKHDPPIKVRNKTRRERPPMS